MKLKIKKQTHYSMLLMRDDTAVRTYRIKGSTLRFFIIFIAVVLLGGAAGITGGLHYWKKYVALAERHTVQDREFGEARMQLERLSNLETLLVATNGTVSTAKNEEIGASASPHRLQNATLPTGMAFNATRLSQPLGATDKGKGAVAGNATMQQATAAQVNAGVEASAGQEHATSAASRISSESSPLRIANFAARISNSQRLRIRYELSTVSQEQRQVVGSARYVAVSANGTRVDLPLQDAGDARFSISRMKVMEAVARMPQGMNVKDIAHIDVSVEVEGGHAFHEQYEITR